MPSHRETRRNSAARWPNSWKSSAAFRRETTMAAIEKLRRPISRRTFRMHSHQGLQEQQLLAAPLILRDREASSADVQEVVMLLHDFSFRQPDEILAGLRGRSSGTSGMNMSGMNMSQPSQGQSGNGM